jgi:hypothetical protein
LIPQQPCEAYYSEKVKYLQYITRRIPKRTL